MFARIGSVADRLRWWLVSILIALTATGFIVGGDVASHLVAGGLEVDDSQAESVDRIVQERFHRYVPDVAVTLRSEGVTIAAPQFRAALADLGDRLRQVPSVADVRMPVGAEGARLVADDGRTALALISMRGSDDDKETALPQVAAVVHATPLDAAMGGRVPMSLAVKQLARRDLIRAEIVAMPLVALLLVVFFRSVVSALIPLVLGAFTIGLSLALLRGLASFMDVSVFALNIVTFLGFGLAIDYSLFIVQRYREELARGIDPRTAVADTNATAGRTITYSAVAVAAALAGLLYFPIGLLRSVAIGGILIVAVTAIASVVLLPALLAVAGRHINALPVFPRGDAAFDAESGRWYVIARWVMRHPVAVVVPAVCLLLAAGTPFLRMQTAAADPSILPPGHEVRRMHEILHHEAGFAPGELAPHRFVIRPSAGGLDEPHNLAAIYEFAHAVGRVPGIVRVESIATSGPDMSRDDFVRLLSNDGAAGNLARRRLAPLLAEPYTMVMAVTNYAPNSPAAAEQVARIRQIAPAGLDILVGGSAQQLAETRAAMRRGLPAAIVTVIGTMLVIMFLAFGAIPVALKAIVVASLSLSAAFGALVWIFQDGRFEHLLRYESPGAIEPTIPIMMFAILFGLSMDYEVFLLSRIREDYDRSRNSRESVARGLSATGRIITGAATMLIVILGAIAAGDLVFLKELGVGMSIAIAIDATLVRALLVPALMVLMGPWSWWAPRGLSAWWRRAGVGVDEGPSPTVVHPHPTGHQPTTEGTR